MMAIIRIIIVTLIALASVVTIFAQDEMNVPPNNKAFRSRIEDLRRIKLLDRLNLQGSQVETFFKTYNASQVEVLQSKDALSLATDDLQKAIDSKASEAELKRFTATVIQRTTEFEASMVKRNQAIAQVVTTEQYAQYILFEARFPEELQRTILKRMQGQKRQKRP